MPLIGLDAKLALAEFLLHSDDVSECARRGLEWLGEHAGITCALCAATTGDRLHLSGVAAIGVSPARTGEFVIDLANRRDPLTAVAYGRRPATFPAGAPRPDTPLDPRMPFHAIPMPSGPRRPPVGLLLVEGLETRPERDLLWFAHVLGEKLLQLRARPQLQDSGLERERRLLFSLINAVSDPILLTDAQGKLITGNARAEQLLAATSESDGHRRALELNNLFFSSALAGTLLGLPDGSPRDVVLVDPGDGSDLLFELLTTPIQLDGGQSAFVSVLRNVTDLGRAAMELKENYTRIRSAEAQARAERNRIELVIDSVVDPIIVSHPNGEILMTNKPADALFTSRASDAATRRRTTANVAQFSSFTSGLLLGDGPDRIRGRLALTDPESARAVPVEAIAAVVPGESDLVAVVTVLHDLTEALEREHLVAELKTAGEQLEERVRDATAELAQQNELLRSQAIALEHASAAKSQFLASISHEFRTPLNAILGYTWLLLQGTTAVDDPEARRMMSKIDSNSRHLAALINTVLDMTRIEADQMPVEVTRFDAAALVREVLEELEAIVSRSKVPITVTAPGRMRPIETDRQKLKQILVNLLTNAVKFTRDGGITVEVSRGAPGRCRIAVRDTGIGIPIEEQSLIFEAFEQGHGARRLSSGTGLGLAISRRLVGLLGGQILVASTVGVGSTFSVEIPSRLPADATADDTPPHRERSKPLAGARA